MKVQTKHAVLFGGGAILTILVVKALWKRKSRQVEEEKEKQALVPVKKEHNKFVELKALLAEEVSEGWDVIKNTPDLQVFKKITESSPIAIIKAKIHIKDTNPEDVLFALWDGNFRREWDTVIKDFHVVESFAEDSDIIYFYGESPMKALISNREFLQNRRYTKEKEGIYIVYWSAEKQEIPIPEGWIRANTIISGYYIKKEDSGVVVEFISQNDIKGQIPPKLVNALAPSKAADWVKKLSKACALLKQKHHS